MMEPRKLSNQNFAELFDAAPDAIVVVNEQGVIEFANRKTEDIFGYSPEELAGQPIEVLVPMRLRGHHVHDRDRYLAAPSSRPMGTGRDLLARHRNGSEFPVEISLSPLRTEGGLLVSSIIRDISARKHLEAGARRNADHLRSAVESIEDAFALFDAEDRLVLCNSTYRDRFIAELHGTVTGRSYDDVLDAMLGALDHRGEPARELRERIVAHHRRPDAPLELTTTSGRSLRISERRTPEGGTVVLALDLTEDVRREEELRKMTMLAEAASTAKSEFLSSMSHELRTPLNAVLGFAQLLRRDKKQPLDERQRTMLDHVIKGGEHLLRLIDDVLDLSRIEAGGVTISPEPVLVPEVMKEVEIALEPLASRNNTKLVVEPVPADAREITADRTRVTQILMNYGSNAIKYGKQGGTVTFRASTSGPRHVRLTVTDDGIGIAADKHGRLFQPFQRAGQETGPIEGTGIGLAITKRLAELMEGEVGFHSEEGKGSEFWVELPSASGGEASLAAVPRDDAGGESLRDADQPRITVVYVEDNPANVAFMEQLLSEFDRVELLTAVNAEIGIELVRRTQPDIVIMDINLPGMSGFDATRKLREWPETRDIPVIGLSAAAMPRDRKRAEEAGLFRYLTKPVDVDALIGVIEEVLAGTLRQSNE
ncbi:MAG TPA: PAS domain S-box protein [Nannocystaceae bacterium]|nr:PAS domain S-box protein [Nannocystaceae bacterium]